jgi:hypothetical protein
MVVFSNVEEKKMERGPKAMIAGTVILVAAVGIRVGLIYRANNAEGPAPAQPAASRTLSGDDYVFLRKLHPDSIKDLKDFIGKPLWMSAGDQMDYYRDTGKHVDYSKPVGVLPGATELLVKEVFEEVAPKTGRAVFRIPAGQRHVLLGFTLPKSADPKTVYAVPVGNFSDGNYSLITDDMFFYDDPHTLYKDWGTEMWSHIDKHEAVLGMSENQAMMSLGEVITPHGDKAGDRTVDFDNDGKPVSIEFEKGKAVRISKE